MQDGRLSPTNEQLQAWRSTLVKAMVTSDDYGVRYDLAEILLALLPSQN